MVSLGLNELIAAYKQQQVSPYGNTTEWDIKPRIHETSPFSDHIAQLPKDVK